MAAIAENVLVAERFRLIRLIGKGGMGSVWEAHHEALDVPCAVKFITCEGHDRETLLRRFEREAKAAAGVRGRHVVQIFDHGVWEGLPYIAMELLRGEDLRARLKRVLVLPPEDVLRITRHVVRALRKAHARGIIHRDLKPDNIFLVYDDDGTQKNDDEVAKVLDFGIAKTVGNVAITGETSTGELLGTPVYMSPEQIRGTRRVDERSDLWSLAVIVYRCLLGQLPFAANSFGDLVLEVCSKPLVVPSSVGAVPEGFDAWWQKAVARRPRDRFQTATEFVTELERVLAPRGSLSSAPASHEIVSVPTPVGAALGAVPRDSVPFVGEVPDEVTTTQRMTYVPYAHPWKRWVIAGAIAMVAFAGALTGYMHGRMPAPPPSPAEPAALAAPTAAPADIELLEVPAPVEPPAPAVAASASVQESPPPPPARVVPKVRRPPPSPTGL